MILLIDALPRRDESCYSRPAAARLRNGTASWRSGYAEDCKSLHPGSIPGEASNKINDLLNGTSEEKCPVWAELEAAGFARRVG